jgi:tetraacyldisaccharide 4'-kinase
MTVHTPDEKKLWELRKRPFLAMMMRFASLLYGGFVTCRAFLFNLGLLRGRRLPGKTISIGNIEVGGTGKTPTACLVAKFLQENGETTAILTRGYKSGLAKNDFLILLNGEIISKKATGNHYTLDEPMLLSMRLPEVPIIVGARRYESAQQSLRDRLLPNEPSIWILDDGFQHRSLGRDIDIVLINSQYLLNRPWLLPFGFLRERVSSLKRADLICDPYWKGDMTQLRMWLRRLKISEDKLLSISIEYSTLNKVRGPRSEEMPSHVVVACGIARPERFLASLAHLGMTVVEKVVTNDHQSFSDGELERIAKTKLPVVTTLKDYYRDKRVFDDLEADVYVLEEKFNFDWYSLKEALLI